MEGFHGGKNEKVDKVRCWATPLVNWSYILPFWRPIWASKSAKAASLPFCSDPFASLLFFFWCRIMKSSVAPKNAVGKCWNGKLLQVLLDVSLFTLFRSFSICPYDYVWQNWLDPTTWSFFYKLIKLSNPPHAKRATYGQALCLPRTFHQLLVRISRVERLVFFLFFFIPLLCGFCFSLCAR